MTTNDKVSDVEILVHIDPGFDAAIEASLRRWRFKPAMACGKPVVITIDNAPWHQGTAITKALAAHPHLHLYRLPSYSPQLNVVERFWRVLRRRATHNRLFLTMAALRTTLRANLCYFHTMRHKVLSLLSRPRKRKAAKVTAA